jgi:hypothetical protein
MKHLVKLIGIACFAAGMTSTSAHASIIAKWTFETSAPTTAGPVAPETGSGSASGSHALAAVYSTPVGNGSSRSYSSNLWSVGDYWQFQASTSGFTGIALTWDQTSSNTGPRDFVLQYSTNGSTFTTFGSQYSVLANASPNPVWSAGTFQSAYSLSYDLSGIPGLNNLSTAYFRLADNSTVSANGGTVVNTGGSSGTDRVDNFTISGTQASAVPLPAAAWLLGSGIVALGGFAKRRAKV